VIRGVILDLDGTVYLGLEEVPGAGRFVAECRAMGVRCLFVTNRANRTPEEVVRQLQGFGIPCATADVLTAAQATARYLQRGSAWYIGEDGLRLALEEQGIAITDERPDYVVVGYDRGFTYEKLFKACRLIDRGATFVATNPDSALKTDKGIYPGTGAIVAAVTVGSGRTPIVIGKPERRIMDMALDRLGLAAGEVIVVGDSLATDVPAGRAAGMRTVLLLTGVSRFEEIGLAAQKPDWVAATFDELLDRVRREANAPYAPAPAADGSRSAAREWIARLGLAAHPEGGWYREVYRSDVTLPVSALPEGFPGPRSASTAIYFLLEKTQFSAFHRIRSDELWHLYDGGPLRIHCLSEAGGYSCHRLAREPGAGGTPMRAVPAGTWFAAELDDAADFALAGCTVAPGFDFADFALARRGELTRRFAEHRALIERLASVQEPVREPG
jgi:4-nitrophenyl phosphatase